MDVAEKVLRDFEHIAVVGASRDPSKAAHAIPEQLLRAGFDVIPVNPLVTELFGRQSYRSLADVKEKVEVVLVFRPAQEAPELAKQAVQIGARALWLQQGITSPLAREIAEGAGVTYVEDRCIGVERSLHRIVKHQS